MNTEAYKANLANYGKPPPDGPHRGTFDWNAHTPTCPNCGTKSGTVANGLCTHCDPAAQAAREAIARTCEDCGTPFPLGGSPLKRFCSERCQKRSKSKRANQARKDDWKHKHDADTEAEIVKAYAAGESTVALGRKYDLSPGSIGKLVKRAGGTLRPSASATNVTAGRYRLADDLTPAEIRMANRSRAAGDSIRVIANTLGISRTTAERITRNTPPPKEN